MNTTAELLVKALKTKKPSEWARLYKITPSTLTNAKNIGRLSPLLAGNLAIDLGENPTEWMAVAALEAERDSPLKKLLKQRIENALSTETARSQDSDVLAPQVPQNIAPEMQNGHAKRSRQKRAELKP